MRKIAVLQLTFAVAVVAASLCVVPGVSAKKRKEDGGVPTPTDENNGNDVRLQRTGHHYDNDINNDVNNNRAAASTSVDDKRFTAAESGAGSTPSQQAKAAAKQSSKQHNAKLLNRLGMKRIRVGGSGSTAAASAMGGNGSGASHHRKRLASQSRSKYGADGAGSASDSQMFIVKLPPHSHFYDDGSHQLGKQAPYKSFNTVPVGFVSNGKPAKVYHWNLPTIKHALQGARYKGHNDAAAMHHHQQQQQHHHHQQQQQMQMQQLYGHHAAPDFELQSVAAAGGSKILPRRTLYYKPRASGKPVKKSFVNNGKPNGFYVVSGKNAAAAPQYHKIVKAYYGGGDD